VWRYNATIINLSTRGRFMPQSLYSLQYAQDRRLRAGWALELIWMLWTREKSLTNAGN
jgi:hypothetical protein